RPRAARALLEAAPCPRHPGPARREGREAARAAGGRPPEAEAGRHALPVERPHREGRGERLEEGGAQVGTPLGQLPGQVEAAGEERAVAPWEGTAAAEGGL